METKTCQQNRRRDPPKPQRLHLALLLILTGLLIILVKHAISGNDKTGPKVLLISYVPPQYNQSAQCDLIDKLTLESIANKLKYAQLKGYETEFNNNTLFTGKFSKIKSLKQALNDTNSTGFDWLVLVDVHTLFVNVSFTIPFQQYNSCNLVLRGYDNVVYEKGDVNGLNTGLIMLRNCNWSRSFVDFLLQNFDCPETLEKCNGTWDEKNAIAYVLRRFPEFRNMTCLESGLAWDWNWSGDDLAFDKENNWDPIVANFANCTSGGGGVETLPQLPVCLDKWNVFLNRSEENLRWEKSKGRFFSRF